MKTKHPAKTAVEFDERFDRGEDIHDLVDLKGKDNSTGQENTHYA
jgi:hypothetical protein